MIGSSGHAKVLANSIELQKKHLIAGLLDDYRDAGESAFGYSILGKLQDLPMICRDKGITSGIIAVGDNWGRMQVVEKIRSLVPQFSFITAIHPSAQLAKDVFVGEGSAIMAGAILNPGSRAEKFCIVNTNAVLDHDSIMCPFSSLAPGATIGGKVRIGVCSAISIGASVVHEVEIGEHTVIGAGAVVAENVAPGVVAVGVPARVLRAREAGDRYL